ncbi:MAG: hypothetical protein SFZ24_12515 [Planctomycetota bacterium]|nr:hypothetical protein [Planctomycetota bacterium]
MLARQRKAHALIWPVLGPALLALLVWALLTRPASLDPAPGPGAAPADSRPPEAAP